MIRINILIFALLSLTCMSGCGIKQFSFLEPVKNPNGIVTSPSTVVSFSNNSVNGTEHSDLYEGIAVFYKFYKSSDSSITSEEKYITEELEGPSVRSYFSSRNFRMIEHIDTTFRYLTIDMNSSDGYLTPSQRSNANLKFEMNFATERVTDATKDAFTFYPELTLKPDPDNSSSDITIGMARDIDINSNDTDYVNAGFKSMSFNLSDFPEWKYDTYKADLPVGVKSGDTISLVLVACSAGTDDDYIIVYSDPEYLARFNYQIP